MNANGMEKNNLWNAAAEAMSRLDHKAFSRYFRALGNNPEAENGRGMTLWMEWLRLLKEFPKVPGNDNRIAINTLLRSGFVRDVDLLFAVCVQGRSEQQLLCTCGV